MDFTGREFNRNRLIALMAAIVLEEVRFLTLAYIRPGFSTSHFPVSIISHQSFPSLIFCSILEQLLSQTV